MTASSRPPCRGIAPAPRARSRRRAAYGGMRRPRGDGSTRCAAGTCDRIAADAADDAAMRQLLTILAVDDLARAARFYEAAFGWRRHVDVPVYVEFETGSGP